MTREFLGCVARLASSLWLVGVVHAQGGAYLGPRELTESLGLGMCGCGIPDQAVDPVGDAWEPNASGHLIHTNGGLPWESWWGFHRQRLLPQRKSRALGRSKGELTTSIVPTLLAALETEVVGSWALHDAAGLALARIARSDPSLRPVVRAPIHAWFSGSFSGVPRAAVAIGLVGDPQDLELLASLATDGPIGRAIIQQPRVYPTMRTYAVFGLDALTQQHADVALRRAAVEVYASALTSTRPDLVDFAIAGAIAMGRCALPPRADSDAKDLMGLEDQFELLLASFDPKGESGWPRGVRAHVLVALARLTAHLSLDSPTHAALRVRVLRALTQTLRRPPEEALADLRFGAIHAAGQVGRAGLDPSDVALRDALAEMLRIGSDAERPLARLALAEALARTGSGERPGAGRESWVSRWVQALGVGAPDERAWTALTLGVHARASLEDRLAWSPDDLQRFRHIAAREKEPAVRAAYAVAFALMLDVTSLDLVREWVREARDQDAGVGVCAESLARLLEAAGEHATVPALQQRLERSQDPDRVVLVGTALAVGGHAEDFGRIVGMLTRPAKRGAESALAEALGAFHGQPDLGALIELVKGEAYRSSDRAAAASALGRLAVPDASGWSEGLRSAVPFPLRTPSQVNADGNGVLQFL